MSKQISVIGCGWLGFPLAKQLIKNGFEVKGSTTSIEKLEILKAANISPYSVEFTNELIKGDIEHCLEHSEILILNVPPRQRNNSSNDFIGQIELLIPYIERSSIKKLLFISSTSVYADDESVPTISEDTIPNPETESGKQLLIIEKLLQNNTNFDTTIVRFSGLFGDDRHPAKFLSGRKNVQFPNAPVNLIHLTDCIGIICSIIERQQWNDLFNASSPNNLSRKKYYTSICKSMKIAPPEFDELSLNKGKKIDSYKLVQILNYDFKIYL